MKETYFEHGFTIRLKKDDALSGSHQGACDDDIAALLKVDYIKNQLDKIPSDSIRKELSEYGAWDETELQNDDANKSRILWIACGNIREELLTKGV